MSSGGARGSSALSDRIGAAGGGDVPGIGVYIHWPYCAQKCPYCDFNSHVRFDGWDEERLARAYLRELENVFGRMGRRRVSSIFFGGGTPSLMQPKTVARIIEAVASLWSLEDDAEITLEANPGSVEAERFSGYRSAGVNRVSVGVQSLREPALKALGRIHSVEEAVSAINVAQKVFERSSFDLIYARPKQSVAQWREELSEALALASGGHLSLYQLTIEPSTPFANLHALGKLVVPDAERSAALFEVTQELTGAAGLPGYEISNHAVLGQESRHNLVYWRYGEYVGVGPGAHGRIVSGGQRFATSVERHPETWMTKVEERGHGMDALEPLEFAQQADEMLLMGLRLREGLDVRALAETGRVRLSPTVVERLSGQGLIEVFENGARLRATGRGRFILNEIVVQLAMGFEPVVQET